MKQINVTHGKITKHHARAILLGRIEKYTKARKRAYDTDNFNQAAYYNGKISTLREMLVLLEEMN